MFHKRVRIGYSPFPGRNAAKQRQRNQVTIIHPAVGRNLNVSYSVMFYPNPVGRLKQFSAYEIKRRNTVVQSPSFSKGQKALEWLQRFPQWHFWREGQVPKSKKPNWGRTWYCSSAWLRASGLFRYAKLAGNGFWFSKFIQNSSFK